MAQLSILDLIERRTSVAMNISEEIIAKVIRSKWKGLHDATSLYTSAEDSGLGKFSTRTKKIIKRIERLNQIIDACTKALLTEVEMADKKRSKFERILKNSKEEKGYLETKL